MSTWECVGGSSDCSTCQSSLAPPLVSTPQSKITTGPIKSDKELCLLLIYFKSLLYKLPNYYCFFPNRHLHVLYGQRSPLSPNDYFGFVCKSFSYFWNLFYLHSLTAHFTCCAPARPQGATCYINNNISDGIMGQILYSHRYNVPWLESRRYCK